MSCRSLPAVFVAVLALSGCSKWRVIADKDPGAMDGQAAFVMLPLGFDSAQIDGEPASKWLAEQDAEQKAAWPAEKEFIWKAFQKAVTDDVGDLKITTRENPEGATLVLRPTVLELETGGYSKSELILGIDVLDAQGTILESISTKSVQGSRRDEFKKRIAEAAENAGEIVARYLKARSGK
ncbi:MAG: hypothetical protein H6Q89_4926 [Myxococcaceae bacterium]|nr:hypothetical protein [Myxococcaceae bacterium]